MLLETQKVGGQAVIEGVMMRSPEAIATAVRTPDDKIKVKYEPYTSLTERNKFFSTPIIRGALSFFEMLKIGITTLSWSSDVAIEEEEKQNQEEVDEDVTDEQEDEDSYGVSGWYIALSLLVAFGLGLLLFFFLPIFLTSLLGLSRGAFLFNLISGFFRACIFLLYLSLISQMKDIRRVFEYHGAEHKSVFTYEADKNLTVENTAPFTTRHPRCGTSFVLVVVLVSIVLFSVVDTFSAKLLGHPPNVLQRFVGHILFLPLLGGISYELLKLSSKYYKENNLIGAFVKPGLWLQHITTREPDSKQLEVAIVALKESLKQKEEEYTKYV